MNDVGAFSLVLALGLAGYVVVAAAAGRRRPAGGAALSARRGFLAATALVTVAVIALEVQLLRGDFHNAYVAGYSNDALPLFYKIAALWAGQAGSLLFWTWLLALFGAAALRDRRPEARALSPVLLVVFGGTVAFFLALVVFAANPFATLHAVAGGAPPAPFHPADGRGLNPLLQHPAMVIHPPVLYLGYVGFVVPFAFAMAALYYRRSGAVWTGIVRRWTLTAWFFLGAGIILGARWAYVELGWGGYWAWDPVENASLMPWLTGTAFLHSAIVQQRRGMLKFWNAGLIALTYLMCIFGTFLTRSGVVQSVHAFAQSGIGAWFAGFLAVAAVASLALILSRRDHLRPDDRIQAVASRETGFLLNNLLLLVAMVAVLVGTLFPALSELVRGTQVSVGVPFFNRVEVPLGLMLLALTGVGPLLAYRRTDLRSLRRSLLGPWLAGVALSLALWALAGIDHVYALVSFGLTLFVALTIVGEFARATAARRRSTGENAAAALLGLFRRNRSRYGGYLVHFGVVLLFVGFTGKALGTQGQLALMPGDTGVFAEYSFTLDSIEDDENENFASSRARVAVARDGSPVAVLDPERRFYLASEQPSSEVAILGGFGHDLYLVLAGWEDDGERAVFQIYRNPLVLWVWVGAVVMGLGTLVCLLPAPRATLPSAPSTGTAAS